MRRAPMHASAGAAAALLRAEEVAVPAVAGDNAVTAAGAAPLAAPSFELAIPFDDGLHAAFRDIVRPVISLDDWWIAARLASAPETARRGPNQLSSGP